MVTLEGEAAAAGDLRCAVCASRVERDLVAKVVGEHWVRAEVGRTDKSFCSIRCLGAHFARIRGMPSG